MNRRSITAGSAYVVIGIRNRLAKGANAVQSDLRRLGGKLQSQGQSMMKAGFLAGSSAIGLLAGPVKIASEMQETMGKFDVVFGKNAKTMQAWSDKTASALGTSRQEMAGMLSGMQDLLVPMGVMPGAAEGMSKELSTLAVDLGSFNNRDTSMVFDDLMAAMTGSGEVMKKYGVVLTEAAVKQELLNQGMDPKNADDAAKAQARLAIIMRGTSAAQGDAIRTSGSFANQTKRLKSILMDAAATIGGPLLDDLAGMVSVVSQGITAVRNFAEQNQNLFRTVGWVVGAVGGLGALLLTAGGALSVAGFAASGLASAMAVAGASLGFLLSPLALVIGGVTALGVGLVKYTDLGANAIGWLTERFGPLVETVKGAASGILDALKLGDTQAAWELAMTAMELIWLDLTDEIRDVWASIMGFVLDSGSKMAQGLGRIFEGLAGVLNGILSAYESYYNKVYDSVIELGGKVTGVRTIGGTGNAFAQNFGGAKDGLKSAINDIKEFGQTMQDTAQGQMEARREQRDADRQARQQRIQDLRQSANEQQGTIKDSVQAAEEKRAAELEKIQSEVDQKQKDLAINEGALGGAQERTGPSGSFSAYGALVGISANEQREDRKVRALETLVKQGKDTKTARFA